MGLKLTEKAMQKVRFMKKAINALVITVFAITTFVVLNWLLDRSWDFKLIGYWMVNIFSVVAALAIGACTGHALLSLLRRQSQYDGTIE